ncbi:MAG: deoxyribonuclease IV [Deltaproteobacteria bacterium]|nr:deoxyribonuclease IV [Deltaproteobacteria bacterium]
MRIGFHVSIAGGFSRSVERAFGLGCTCMQIFSRNPRGWTAKPLDPDDIAGFKTLRKKRDIAPVFVHTNYLINLASPRDDLFEKSIEHFIVDLERAERLGAEYLVIHLGSASGRDAEWMIGRVSQALNEAMQLHPPQAVILLENTAGEAGDVGYALEQIGEVISRLGDSVRIGICYDTCHGFAAGYDVRTKKDVNALVKKIEATVGLERLKGMHVNDCLLEFRSHRDRHWHIGEGKIGLGAFKVLLNHPVFREIPMIMETPKKTEADDPRNMEVVKSLIR